MRTEERAIYLYAELSERAQEKARDWYRAKSNCFEANYITSEAKEFAAIMGIRHPQIYWRVAYGKGNGACIVGDYYPPGADHIHLLRSKDAPKEVIAIAENLAVVQALYENTVYGTISQIAHYHSMQFDLGTDCFDGVAGTRDLTADDEGEVKIQWRAFAHWIYMSLDAEYEYTQTDEYVADALIANEYEFTVDGVLV